MATAAAVDFQNAIGRERIEGRVRQLASALRARLEAIPGVTIHTSAHPELGCGITGFAFAGFDRRDVVETLWRRHHIWVRHTDFDLNTVRVSTHYYNTEDQIDRLDEGCATSSRAASLRSRRRRETTTDFWPETPGLAI